MVEPLDCIYAVLVCLLLFKDMSGARELRKIREELEKMNWRTRL